MAGLDVTVHIPKIGNPDFSFTEKQLKAWELVTFSIGQAGSRIDPLNFAQVGGCNFVKDCGISVHVDFTFHVARELKESIKDAHDAGNTPLANALHIILLRVEQHARTHYERVVNNVILTWESDLQKDLTKTLPTDRAPTSLPKSGIQARVADLVAYWVAELGYRMARDVNEWEREDYPQLEKFVHSIPGADVFLSGFPIPRFLKKQPSRPTIAFPACRPKGVQAKPGSAR
jgi:hypothetical protein